jgi:hypothetical protein
MINNIILRWIVFIILFLIIIVSFNSIILSEYFQVDNKKISNKDVNILYMTLGLKKPDNITMNTSGSKQIFSEMKTKENIIVAGVGFTTMSILALVLKTLIL